MSRRAFVPADRGLVREAVGQILRFIKPKTKKKSGTPTASELHERWRKAPSTSRETF